MQEQAPQPAAVGRSGELLREGAAGGAAGPRARLGAPCSCQAGPGTPAAASWAARMAGEAPSCAACAARLRHGAGRMEESDVLGCTGTETSTSPPAMGCCRGNIEKSGLDDGAAVVYLPSAGDSSPAVPHLLVVYRGSGAIQASRQEGTVESSGGRAGGAPSWAPPGRLMPN